MWLCDWCAINGKYPVSEAYRPDTEEPVVTQEGNKICQSCAAKYYKAKAEAEREEKESKDASTRISPGYGDHFEGQANWSSLCGTAPQ
jgi:hypothetical protein